MGQGLGVLLVVGESGMGDKERCGPLNLMETPELLSIFYTLYSPLTLG